MLSILHVCKKEIENSANFLIIVAVNIYLAKNTHKTNHKRQQETYDKFVTKAISYK